MSMEMSSTWMMVGAVALGTFLTRAFPFLVFRGDKEVPKTVLYIGKALPAAVISILVLYCLRDVNWGAGSHGIPEVVAMLLVAILHRWKRNNLISIGVGTIVYMLLVQVVFV